MAYTPHVLFVFGGSWAADLTEIWECTVRLEANGGGGVTLDCDAYLAAISLPLKTWFAAAGTAMSSRAQLKWIKANHVGADGRYVDGTTTHVRDYGPIVTGGAPDVGPQFCTLAYTWETAVARGPAHRGRIYPPNATRAPSTSFKVDSGQRDANAANGAGLLAVLKNTAGADAGTHATPCIASNIGGAIHAITGCTSDDIYDVQRRRKNRVVGSRSAAVAFA